MASGSGPAVQTVRRLVKEPRNPRVRGSVRQGRLPFGKQRTLGMRAFAGCFEGLVTRTVRVQTVLSTFSPRASQYIHHRRIYYLARDSCILSIPCIAKKDSKAPRTREPNCRPWLCSNRVGSRCRRRRLANGTYAHRTLIRAPIRGGTFSIDIISQAQLQAQSAQG